MNYNNYSISRKKGKFYLKEKQPTEGYEEVIYGTDNSKTYHKYQSTIQGTPTYFGTKEIEYQGRKLNFLELSLVDGDTTNKISVNLKNKGGYTDEAKLLLSALDGYEVGNRVTMTPKLSTSQGKNGKTYENLNMYMNYTDIKNEDGKGKSTGFINYADVPAPIKGDDGMGGSTWDFTPANKFYFQKLQEIEERFASSDNNSGQDTASAPTQQAATPKQEPAKDDLPF